MDKLLSGAIEPPGWSITSNNGHYMLVFQSDGNLVLYVQYRGLVALWSTRTNGQPSKLLAMQVQDDGNVVIYVGTTPIWATSTAGSDPLGCVSTIQNVAGVRGSNSATGAGVDEEGVGVADGSGVP
jgi:hypothetical protein